MHAFLIAGEASGDNLGAALMVGLKQLAPGIRFSGIGGAAMQAEGLGSQFPMDELSVMGIAEVLPKYRHLKRRIRETAQAVLADPPDVLITIDSPDFCLRVARLVRAAAPIRTVHYVAPSVWAWRAGRAAKMARVIDQVLALLPFEPPLMEAAGMRCDFVGHPVATEPVPSDADIVAFRDAQGLGDAPVVLILPGSRQGEVSRLLPVFGAALRQLSADKPSLRAVIPAAPAVEAAVRSGVANWPGQPVVLSAGVDRATKRAAFAAADVALAASGTVSLELAAADTPMVIAYDMNWLSWQIMSRMVRIDTVTLVNLITEQKVVPEFLGPDCQPEPIAAALATLLDDPSTRAAQHAAMVQVMQVLGRGGEAPGLRAARAVLDGLGSSNAG